MPSYRVKRNMEFERKTYETGAFSENFLYRHGGAFLSMRRGKRFGAMALSFLFVILGGWCFVSDVRGAVDGDVFPNEPSANGPSLLRSSDVETPSAGSRLLPLKKPLVSEKKTAGQPTPVKRKSATAPTPSSTSTPSTSDPRPISSSSAETSGAPQELPTMSNAEQPSPLRIEVSEPTKKPSAGTNESKVLEIKTKEESAGKSTGVRVSPAQENEVRQDPVIEEPAETQPRETQPKETVRTHEKVPPRNSISIPEKATSKNSLSTREKGSERNAGRDVSADPDPIASEEEHPQSPENAPSAIATDREPAAETSGKSAPASSEGASLEPLPDFDQSGPAPLEAASFSGVTPGQTTLEEVEEAWGSPKEVFKQQELMTQLYSIKPFDRIEVTYEKNVVAAIVVRFEKSFPAAKIAEQLDMATIKPVLVVNEMGEVLGQSYPERGVLFAFESSEDKSKPSDRVTHILIESINAEPFLLRAESEMESRSDRSLQDLKIALELQPDNARGQWLYSRVLSAQEQFEKALEAAAEATRLDSKNPRYAITHAQVLGQMGRLREALQEAQRAVEIGKDQPQWQARAYCLMGDLIASGPKPDYRRAIGYHAQALQTAEKAARSEHPAVRKTAKEVLVDAHLGSAHDIAWGDWKDKEKAVTLWLKKATVIAQDLVKNENGTEEQLFRVQTRALSACVGIRSGIDPKPWLDEAIQTGNRLIAAARDPVRKAQYQWELGMAMYDAVQISQLRADHVAALRYGEEAVQFLEQGHARKQTPTTAYLLGRLYFRLGAIHAIRDKDHESAVEWFEKGIPLLEKPIPPEAFADLGRHGETFVSMGVSYWETGNRDKAIDLTQHGINLMEEAVRQGTLDRKSLAIPYNNLAAMHRQVGSLQDAEKYQEMAARIKEVKTR